MTDDFGNTASDRMVQMQVLRVLPQLSVRCPEPPKPEREAVSEPRR